MTSSADRQQVRAHFDEAAATWDDNPHRRALTEAIAKGIRETVPLDRNWRMLEYGCGTGSLSFLLAPEVREVIAADLSPGMIEQVRRKLTLYPNAWMTPQLLDLAQDPAPQDTFDLIVTAMALHHVEDVNSILLRLGSLLARNGWLAVADLCSEDGSFHEPMKVPHNGFVPESLADAAAQRIHGVECHWQIVHSVEKNGRLYDVFLLVAHRGLSSATGG